MPTSSYEINLLESFTKFEALRELLEDDIRKINPSQYEFEIIAVNYPAYKEWYLKARVCQKKYNNRSLPSLCAEADFNSAESSYKYNDN